ncbi:DUF1028 domain-containing protein, partial [Candidatus Bathyarchaeota archaeon]|nr:DUF1028 domain-containing protein [Candidatus Bathyarchaeota archaeon]
AISGDSKLMGVAVASGSTAVGDRVPHARPGIGVVATQAYTNVAYGIKGLELLTNGLSPREALDRLLKEDSKRELRQVAIMDFKRRRAVFHKTVVSCWSGEATGEDYVVVGNLLAGKRVASSIAEGFERTCGDLGLRMVKALEAGSESGGDRRGERSAALVVVGLEKVEVKIKVRSHRSPIKELTRKLRAYKTA